ncbi:MAG: phage tail sheath subtilisin-like domain-containing protein [Ktedonobacteraceae bacterium]
MPITPTYPGVYIQELDSGVHTITGVATSITAFVGSAPRGVTNDPAMTTSFADFDRNFGGLTADSYLGYAVRDFFLNGGSQALIVRVAASDATSAALTVDDITLQALSPGAWGKNLRARVDYNTQMGPDGKTLDPDLFNLFIKDLGTGQLEVFRNVSVNPNKARLVDRVLASESKLVQVTTKPLPAARPSKSPDVAAGADPWSDTNSYHTFSTQGSDGTAGLDSNAFIADEVGKKGIFALAKADLFNLLVIPPYKLNSTGDGYDTEGSVITAAADYCQRRRAVLIVDSPSSWTTVASAVGVAGDSTQGIALVVSEVVPNGKNAAIFFPRIVKMNKDNQQETFAPGGSIAGVFARTDAQRGVWKAPAGLEAGLAGVLDLSVRLNDPENGELNPLGVNCLRNFAAAGNVVWGARTLEGNDSLASQWKYIPVRRTALYIEESLYRGTQWVVFEPNDEPLWAQIRLNVGAFMHNLFRKGAFQGKTPREAYLVKCDSETTTQNDIDLGIVNILVGFAPLKPAEFVIISIQQLAGQIQV